MKKHILLLVAVALSTFNYAQNSFQKNLVSPNGMHLSVNSMKATNDGGLLVGGLSYFNNWNAANSFIAKTDANGQLQWSKDFSTNVSTSSYDMQLVGESQGGGYFALLQSGVTSPDYGLIHLDGNGNVDWSKVYNVGQTGYTYNKHVVKQAVNGDYVINLSNNNSLCVLRTDNVGNLIWGKTFLGDTAYGKCPGFDCEISAGGDIMLTGKRNDDRMLVKIDQYGQVLWTKIINDNGYTHLKKIKALPGGDFICAGLYIASNLSSTQEGLILRMDANGNTIWRKTYTPAVTSNIFAFYDLEIMNNGEMQLVGSNYTTPVLVHTDAMGNIIETREIGTSMNYVNSGIPEIDLGSDGLLSFVNNGDMLVNSTSLHVNPIFKMNTLLSSGNTCVLESATLNTSIGTEPLNLTINTGMTTASVGTVVSGVTFSTTTFPIQLDNFCQLIGINEPVITNSFNVFPNPVNGNEAITVSFAKNFSGNIQLLDMTGRQVLNTTVNATTTVQLETGKLSKGIYLMRSTSENNETVVSKIVIE